jgi:glycosyltransferase involved in cell wall biosynthesis
MDYPPRGLLTHYLYGRAVDAVIAISPAVAEALGRGGATPQRLRIVHSGVDCNLFAPPSPAVRAQARVQLGLRPDELAVVALGALVPRKGHRVLIHAMALARQKTQARDEGARLRAFIAGAGPLHAELGCLAAELGVADAVKMLGTVQDPRMLLWAADIFVMPSIAEGLGVAALEAMACGVAAIVSNVGGLTDIVTDWSDGVRVPAGDANALADAIIALQNDHNRRLQLSSAARQRVLSSFSMDAMTKGTLNVYKELLDDRLLCRSDAKRA